MNSEKVKEIKKALEHCGEKVTCRDCPEYNNEPVIDWFECKKNLLRKSITLINELESENENLSAIGCDEVGTGDYFGPIVVCATYVNTEQIDIGTKFSIMFDGEEEKDLTPWYATMYVKKEYRKQGCSKLLHNAILEEAKNRGFIILYLKTDLNNYYEKFGAIFIKKLNSGEKLYKIELK